MKKETKVQCPECGAEFEAAKKGFTIVATLIGKDAGVGIVYPAMAARQSPPKPAKTAQERIEALRNIGVDVSNLFAMRGANGGEFIASNKDGELIILKDDDPIFQHITRQGTVPNRSLFRRWVAAQMFHMLSYVPHGQSEPIGVTEMIHRLGYDYQWKMLMSELYAQMKMEEKDAVNFTDRNRWFNRGVVKAMAEDYIAQMKNHVEALPEKRCKRVPYKRINSEDIFVSDLHKKLYSPLNLAMMRIAQAKNAAQLYSAANKFNDMRIKMPYDTPQSKAWIDAYKGSGAFFTMQNLIRFHGCVLIDDKGMIMDKSQSLAFLTVKAELYKDGEGWRLLAVLKKMLGDNSIDIKKTAELWRKKK